MRYILYVQQAHKLWHNPGVICIHESIIKYKSRGDLYSSIYHKSNGYIIHLCIVYIWYIFNLFQWNIFDTCSKPINDNPFEFMDLLWILWSINTHTYICVLFKSDTYIQSISIEYMWYEQQANNPGVICIYGSSMKYIDIVFKSDIYIFKLFQWNIFDICAASQ